MSDTPIENPTPPEDPNYDPMVVSDDQVLPEKTVQDSPAESLGGKLPYAKAQNAEGDPPNEKMLGVAKAEGGLAMPSATTDIVEASDKLLHNTTEVDPTWASVLEASEASDTDGEMEAALADPNRQWERAVKHGQHRVGSRDLRNPTSDRQPLTGRAAVTAYRGSANNGSIGGQIVCWSSGLSLKFDPLSNSQRYKFHHALTSDRIRAGRSTFGQALSAHMVYSVEAVLEAAESVYSGGNSSLRADVSLGDAILATDFQTLVWGLAQSTYPDGFDMARACIAQPSICNHVVYQRVAPRRMWLVDRTGVSDAQRAMLYDTPRMSMGPDELEKYRKASPRAHQKTVDVLREDGSAVTYVFRVPTLNQMISSGRMWIDEINAAVVGTIGEKASLKERNDMMMDLMRAAAARQYIHWVESIKFPGHEQVITKQEDIARVLEEGVSASDIDLNNFIQAVRNFYEEMTVATVVVSNFVCPACGKHQMRAEGTEAEDEQPPFYIPVEAMNTFFGLTYLHLVALAKR